MLHAPPSEPRPATTKVRCPKCRGADLYVTEIGEWTTQWEVRSGSLDRAAGNHEPGAVDHIEARCMGCSHRWRLRGVYQIDDVAAPSPS
jgi:hypothetical protein